MNAANPLVKGYEGFPSFEIHTPIKANQKALSLVGSIIETETNRT